MEPNLISNSYAQARDDFHRARRRASLQTMIAQITGKSIDLLPFDEITRRIRASGSSERGLRDVPLDAIIGSVSRYSDYSRSFLPLLDDDRERWVGIKMELVMPGKPGLPPVDLYKIGDAYFVKDGHHRISVAKNLRAKYIQAYVTEISSPVPLSEDTTPEQLILKEEYASFLERTQLHDYFPDAAMQLSFVGLYATLEEHINVHRYYMGIEALHEISYEDAVKHWYETIYQPIANLIREMAILHEFPDRTEADLYIWISDHRTYLERELGWKVRPEKALQHMVREISPRIKHILYRMGANFLDRLFPLDQRFVNRTGSWRESKIDQDHLINDILVPVEDSRTGLNGLEQALVIAGRENSQLLGLHVIGKKADPHSARMHALEKRFNQRCREQAVDGHLTILKGDVARIVNRKALLSDLIVLNLDHPPGDTLASRMTSGLLDIIRRSGRSVLATPRTVSPLLRILLAFVNSPTSREAMYMSAYFASRWGATLGVVTVTASPEKSARIQSPVNEYLKKQQLMATYYQPTGYVSEGILKSAADFGADLLVIGGFNRPAMVEVVLDMTLDQLLRSTKIPILICQ